MVRLRHCLGALGRLRPQQRNHLLSWRNRRGGPHPRVSRRPVDVIRRLCVAGTFSIRSVHAIVLLRRLQLTRKRHLFRGDPGSHRGHIDSSGQAAVRLGGRAAAAVVQPRGPRCLHGARRWRLKPLKTLKPRLKPLKAI